MESSTAPRSFPARLQLAAVTVAAAAMLGRWVLGGLTTLPVPPGLLLLAGAAAGLFAVRRRAAVAVALVATGLVAAQLGYRVNPRLLFGSTGGSVATALWLQITAVGVALVAGVAALVVDARVRRSAAGATHEPVDRLRTAQLAGLLVLAPICAEYLAAYDNSTGHPIQLALGLMIFVPLYGCAALLIREVARRFELGWVGIVFLGVAFGLLQAGVVDQSLFSQDYRGIEGWESGYAATLIAPFGISAFNALNFVGGHAVFSIAAPIGLIEAVRPATARQPWLTRRGLAIAAAVYAAGSSVVLSEHLKTESDHASTAQVVGAVVVIIGLVAAAFGVGCRARRSGARPAPRPATVLIAVLFLATAQNFATEDWAGVVLTGVTYGLAGLGLTYASRLTGWGVRHVAAACAAPLLVRAALAFTYPPLIGEVSDQAKYTHNAVLLILVLGLSIVALRRRAQAEGGVSQSPTTLSSGSRK